MSQPTISVVIPTYNRSGLLPASLDSVLAQTAAPDEVIVVDDGSKDDTAEVVRRYGQAVRYVRRQNGGLSRARNTGIEAATGDWVAFLDDDDAYEPEKIAATREVIARFADADVIATNACMVSPSGKTQGMFELRSKEAPLGGAYVEDPLSWVLSSCFFAQSLVVRRSVLAEVGGFTPDLYYEDFDLCSRMAVKHKWVMDGRQLFKLIRRDDGGSNLSFEWSKNPVRSYTALTTIYGRLLADLGDKHKYSEMCRRRLCGYYFELGAAHGLSGDWKKADEAFASARRLGQSLKTSLKVGLAKSLGRPWLQWRRDRILKRTRESRQA